MDRFWIGRRGEGNLEPEQIAALEDAGYRIIAELRESPAPGEWRTLRSYVSATADNQTAARDTIAAVLGIDASDLLTHHAGTID